MTEVHATKQLTQVPEDSVCVVLDKFAKTSIACSIGCELLNIKPSDNLQDIFKKMMTAGRQNPEHLTEIFMAGMLGVVQVSESQDEVLEVIGLSMLVADEIQAA